MADEKTNSKDSTGDSAFAVQRDEMQNEMASSGGIAADHTHDRSSSNPGFIYGFSGFANNVDGISNLAHNVGRSSNFAQNMRSNSSMVRSATEFFVPPQNIHGWTLNDNNVYFVQGFGENMGAGFHVVDSNAGFPGEVMPVARANRPDQASNVPIGPSHVRNTTGFPPVARPIRYRTRFPPNARPIQYRTRFPPNAQPIQYRTRFPPIAHPIQYRTRFPPNARPIQYMTRSQKAEIYPVPPQAQTSASLSSLPTTAAFLQAASQSTALPSQTAHPSSNLAKDIQSLHLSKGKSKIIFPTRPPGQGNLIARGRGLAQASNSSDRQSQKREANIHSSFPASAQTAPLAHQSYNAPVPSRALTAASFPSFPQTADYLRNLSQSHVLPYSLQTVRPYSQMAREIPHIRIPEDLNTFPEPIGYRCLLCNLDLSFTPEGLTSQPGMRPSTAVLPCGHQFHDHCLQQITPADQTENPPCIECQKHEAEEEKMNHRIKK